MAATAEIRNRNTQKLTLGKEIIGQSVKYQAAFSFRDCTIDVTKEPDDQQYITLRNF